MTDSLGLVELKGLAAALVAANRAVNTADVTVAGFGYLQDGQVAVTLRGRVEAVRAAVEAIRAGAGPSLVGPGSVIARVEPALEPVLRERAVAVGGRAGAPPVPGRGRGHGSGTGRGQGGARQPAARRQRAAAGRSGTGGSSGTGR